MTIPKRRNAEGFTLYSEVGDWYSNKYLEMGGGWHTPPEEIDEHLDKLGLPQDARGLSVIDFGFGDGQALMRVVIRGATGCGVDLSEVGRTMAYERYERDKLVGYGNILLFLARMEETGFPSDSFDFTYSLGSMEHALDISAAVNEMARVLKPGGKWLLYVPNEEWIHEDQPLETTAPSSWWISLVESAGLAVNSDEKIRDNNRIIGMKPA